jgi:hypothetical protein
MAVSDFHKNMMDAAINQRSDGVHRRNSPSTDDVRFVTKKRTTPASKNRPSLLSRKMGTSMPAKKIVTPAGKRAPKKVIRPKLRTRNAQEVSSGKRVRPTLIQTFLDASPTYNLISGFGRKIRGYADPRG